MPLPVLDWESTEKGQTPRVKGSNKKVAWAAHKGAQANFMTCNVFEALIEGNRGGGKSDVLLMDFAQDVGKGFGQGWSGILFRRYFGDLEDMIERSKKWFGMMFPDARFVSSPHPEWVFATGERLLFRVLRRHEDYSKVHGHEYAWIGYEELTLWADPSIPLRAMTLCRTATPGVFSRVRATTNPYGPGHGWVKKRYKLPIRGAKRGRIIGDIVRTPDEEDRVAVHSDLKENKALLAAVPTYQKRVVSGARNTAERRAWEDGDWDIVAGTMFDDLWDSHVHLVPSFPMRIIPRTWRIDRSYDHGSSKPFSVGWWAESNGEPIEWAGQRIGTIRGDLIRLFEWFGSPDGSNEGLRLTAREIADGIVEREQDMGIYGRVRPGPADDQIFHAEPGVQTIASQMQKVGVSWVKASKGPGSRKNGWEMIRQLLRGAKVNDAGIREDPGIFACDRCLDYVDKLPHLPRSEKDPDDADTDSNDHLQDEVRYRVFTRSSGVKHGTWR